MPKTLLFGGSFDPIHHGHLIVARTVAERLDIERVVLIPAKSPPHKNAAELVSAEHRIEMCRRAVRDDPLFEVSDWETHQTGPNYTLHTVRAFRQRLPAGAWLGWLIGMDSLIELPTWHEVGQLAAACTLVTAARPGFTRPDLSQHAQLIDPSDLERIVAHILETPEIEISASDIRARRRRGASVRYLVPDPVDAYLRANGLYAA